MDLETLFSAVFEYWIKAVKAMKLAVIGRTDCILQ